MSSGRGEGDDVEHSAVRAASWVGVEESRESLTSGACGCELRLSSASSVSSGERCYAVTAVEGRRGPVTGRCRGQGKGR